MTRKTKNKWNTKECPGCSGEHTNYRGKLDKDDIEYVICGTTNKRCNISNPLWEEREETPYVKISRHGLPKTYCDAIKPRYMDEL